MRVLPSFKKWIYSLGTIWFLGFLCTLSISAQESEGEIILPPSNPIDTIEVIEVEDDPTNIKPTDAPTIHDVQINGNVDSTKQGVSVFDSIEIEVTGQNITDDHLLTEEGIHFSNKSEVKVIKGKVIEKAFGDIWKENQAPNIYSINPGDQGRITYVGKTKSGVDLDLIWTICSTDAKEWKQYNPTSTISQGVVFTCESTLKGNDGDAISVLPYGITMIDIFYQIVQHNTMKEMPIMVSFITSDIDGKQGIQTNLDNLARIIPENTSIKVKDGVIYDSVGIGVEGSQQLPQGGYMGAGFVSHFEYIFYVPAPAFENSYKAVITRYDLFGSALQAKGFHVKKIQHVTIQYTDNQGNTIKESDKKLALSSAYNVITVPKIYNYQWKNYMVDYSNPNYPVIKLIYDKTYTITFQFLDQQGKALKESQSFTKVASSLVEYIPSSINGYNTPKSYSSILKTNTIHSFIYTLIEKPIEKIIEKIEEKEIIRPDTKNEDVKSTSNQNQPQPQTKTNNQALLSTQEYFYYPQIYAENKPKETEKDKNKDKEAIDWFCKNTGMTKKEKEIFTNYLKAVKKEAEEKFGDDKDRINHAIFTAIAYPIYSKDAIQTKVNNFEVLAFEKIDGYDKYSSIIKDLSEDSKKKDLPHMAVALASLYSSSTKTDFAKSLLSYRVDKTIPNFGLNLIKNYMISGLFGVVPFNEKTILNQNSFYGDWMTTMNEKDMLSDMDAYILKYHPDYKELSTEKRFLKYYGMPNLDKKREKLYNEAKKSQSSLSKDGVQPVGIFLSTFLSLGGIGLLIIKIKDLNKNEPYRKAVKGSMLKAIKKSIGNQNNLSVIARIAKAKAPIQLKLAPDKSKKNKDSKATIVSKISNKRIQLKLNKNTNSSFVVNKKVIDKPKKTTKKEIKVAKKVVSSSIKIKKTIPVIKKMKAVVNKAVKNVKKKTTQLIKKIKQVSKNIRKPVKKKGKRR